MARSKNQPPSRLPAQHAPPPPPGFPPSAFKSWKLHELQEYLLKNLTAENEEIRIQIPLIHIKGRLIKIAMQCEQIIGKPATKPAEHPGNHVRAGRAGKRFVQRSKGHHDAMRAAQRNMYHRNVQQGGGNTHGFAMSHPHVQEVGFANASSHTSMMVGSTSKNHYAQAQQSLHNDVHGDNAGPQTNALAESTSMDGSNGKFFPPNILVARAYRNWHSPRDHEEYERRKKTQIRHRNKSMQHTNPMKEWMKEGFDYDKHPEVDWPKYGAWSVKTGRHCPDCCTGTCCRVFCDPCGESGKHGGSDWAGHFGVGHDLYFKYLKLVGTTFFIMSLIMLPAMVINSFGSFETDIEGVALYKLSLGNLGDANNHNGTIKLPCNWLPGAGDLYWKDCFMEREFYAWFYGISDFCASLVFMLSIGWLWHYESSEIQHFKELANFASISDYSVFVKNIPVDWKIESYDNHQISVISTELENKVKTFFTGQIQEHVKQHYPEDIKEFGLGKTLQDNIIVDSTGEIVADVTLCLDEGSDIKFYQARKPLKKDLNRTEWHIKKMKFELAKAKKDGDGDSKNLKAIDKITKHLKKEKASRAKIIKKMRSVLQKRKKSLIKSKEHKKVVGVFVTFTTDMAHHLCLERYPKSYCSWLCQKKDRRWHGTCKSDGLPFDDQLMKRVRLKKAPEPTTLMWENFEIGWSSRCCRKGGTSLVALCMLVGSAVAVYYAKTVDNTVAANYCDVSNPKEEIFPGILCSDYVNSTKNLDSETMCQPVLKLYSDPAMFNSKVAEGNVTGLGSTCYCRKYAVDSTVGPEIASSCTSYLLYSAQKLGAVLLSSFMIVFINGVYNKVVQCMAHLERHHAIDSMHASISYRAMLGQFCNTGLVYLLVNANFQGNAFFANYNAAQTAVEGAAGNILNNVKGYNDFTPKWYAEVGNAIALTMLMLAFTPHVFPLISYVRFHTRVNCVCCLSSAATQSELNQKFNPPQFHYMMRYAQLTVSILICMMYSTGIPFLYVVGCLSCFTFYWVDKMMFCWLYAKPPQYDPTINQTYSVALGYALLFHVAFGTWMLGNRSIFTSAVGNQTKGAMQVMDQGAFAFSSDVAETALNTINAYDIREHLLQIHVLPMFVLMIGLLLGIALHLAWDIVGGILRRVWNLITCGKCAQGKTVYLKANFEEVKEDIKLWGISSYNIFDNPIYQMLFSTDAEFASKHRHLEDLGDIDAIAKKEVEMSVLRSKSDKGMKTI